MTCGIKQIVKRDGNVVAYDRERIAIAIFKAATSVGGSDRKEADRLALLVEEKLVGTYGEGGIPSVEEIQDIVETVLIEQGHAKTARAYILYRHERQMARAQRSYAFEVTDNIPYKKIYEVLRWNMDHGCDTIEGLNEIIATGKLPDLIHACERRYDLEVELGAQRFWTTSRKRGCSLSPARVPPANHHHNQGQRKTRRGRTGISRAERGPLLLQPGAAPQG